MGFKVSIIIPVFNRADLVLETLESIENQTFKNWECLILDDGSVDSTASVINEFIKDKSKYFLFNRPESSIKGAPSCRNIGFNLSKGDFIQWFDSDDIMHPTMLEEKVTALISNPTLDFVVAKMDDLINGDIKTNYYNLNSDNLIFDYIRNKVYFFTPGPLFRKSFLLDKKLFNTDLKRHQESEFYFRLLLLNPNFLVINKSLSLRRIHDNSIKSTISQKDEKHLFLILLGSYLRSISNFNLSVWNNQLFIYFLKWSRSSIKFFLNYLDFRFLYCGIQLFSYSIVINWKKKFQ
ncbi:glycosyltransferase family 2 protein [Algoriphagus sp. SE2]|uniref:glycosyltransferase family 2 protein n=1 Tax=Algoriphagus sp. SE2 TaxID=3141536 RepID=UPI0031CCDC8A